MTLTIKLTEKGIRSVTAKVRSISEADQAGKLSAAISLPLSLLHRTIIEQQGGVIDVPVPATVIEGA